jgi:protein-tyrosine phosphatase
MQKVRICFVCLGNICRSPLAEAVLRHKAKERGLADKVVIESRGTGSWHLGEPADPRMRATAARHGVDVDGVAEQFGDADYEAFDLIFGMDTARTDELRARAPDHLKHRVVAFRRYDPEANEDHDVPDPYYGGDEGFETVYRIVERTCDVLLDRIATDTLEA